MPIVSRPMLVPKASSAWVTAFSLARPPCGATGGGFGGLAVGALHNLAAAGDPPPKAPALFAARKDLDRKSTGFWIVQLSGRQIIDKQRS
jgi:hypothetical protein